MEAVTGSALKSDVLQLAAKLVEICREHTTSVVTAMVAVQIAEKTISAEWEVESK
jgi:hypothetical protein